MPSGAGFSPAGIAPYGYGTPDAAPIPGGLVYRDQFAGGSLAGALIDPKTRDYTYDAYGRRLGMTEAQQFVELALSTELGSSAVRTMGQQLRTIDKVTSNFERRVRDTITSALQPGITRKLLSIVAIEVTRVAPSKNFVRVRWMDLTTRQEQESTL